MNKKRFLLFLAAIICIILIPVMLFIFRQPKTETSLLTASNQEDINQFYYRAVPGLKMAEDAGLVRDINKKLDWPGRNAALFIDRIWYNTKQITIFYHVEGVSEAVYLGGELYLPSNEPVVKQPFHGTSSIGRASEKGILYSNSFYSCLKLPPIHSSSGRTLQEIDILIYTPFINIPNQKDQTQIESVPLKSFEIPLNFQADEETTVKIPVDNQIELDGRRLHFYQIDQSPSILRVYFQYLNSGRDMVYRVTGSYTTDKGETHSFDALTKAITGYPYHYILEIPPYHIAPDIMHLQIDSIYCIGNDSVTFKLDTNKYEGRNRSYETVLGRNKIMGTGLFIRNITLNQDFAEILIAYEYDREKSPPYIMLNPMPPHWTRGDDLQNNTGNNLIVTDGDYRIFNQDEWAYGTDILPEEGMRICLDRRFWNEADSIQIRINNLTYVYRINKSAQLALHHESP